MLNTDYKMFTVSAFNCPDWLSPCLEHFFPTGVFPVFATRCPKWVFHMCGTLRPHWVSPCLELIIPTGFFLVSGTRCLNRVFPVFGTLWPTGLTGFSPCLGYSVLIGFPRICNTLYRLVFPVFGTRCPNLVFPMFGTRCLDLVYLIFGTVSPPGFPCFWYTLSSKTRSSCASFLLSPSSSMVVGHGPCPLLTRRRESRLRA